MKSLNYNIVLQVFFVLCFIALTAAAPQFVWPGYVGPTLGGVS